MTLLKGCLQVFFIYYRPVFVVCNLAVCPFAAKVRRLYDIANVLRSLKLIEKVHVTCEEKGRKPAFEWVGPEEFPPVTGIDAFFLLFPPISNWYC